MLKVLFLTSEAYPLIKTGGLADVSASLPLALQESGLDVRLALPAYPEALANAGDLEIVAEAAYPQGTVRIVAGHVPRTNLGVWLIQHEGYFTRSGNPYLGPDRFPWVDNAQRFALLCQVATDLALDRFGLAWHADVLHGNDWQTGLAPVFLRRVKNRPATVFTVHNLAYQGLFPKASFVELGLSPDLWSHQALEFWNQLSFIKGGLVFADKLSTVSPTYAQEIQSEEHGCGLDGLLRFRRDDLVGILNGIDRDQWNPERDLYIPSPYGAEHLDQKQPNKRALQRHFNLPELPDVPVLGSIGRLVHQKGTDLILQLLPNLANLPVQLVFLGTGEAELEQGLQNLARRYPGRIGVSIGYDEALAHLIEAGSDIFLMPSRFEPCGLNQMYSQRYGTIPIVRHVGGLADTVDDASATNLTIGRASGFVFREATAEALMRTIQRALALFPDRETWRLLQQNGMRKDFSWQTSAHQYRLLYAAALQRDHGVDDSAATLR